jgi:hypothetical protein
LRPKIGNWKFREVFVSAEWRAILIDAIFRLLTPDEMRRHKARRLFQAKGRLFSWWKILWNTRKSAACISARNKRLNRFQEFLALRFRLDRA